jgi:hypothetical protein
MLRGAPGQSTQSSSHCFNYLGVTATLTGVVAPAPLKGDPLSAPPPLVNALTEFDPLFAIHTFPEPSIAMLDGALRPLPL